MLKRCSGNWKSVLHSAYFRDLGQGSRMCGVLQGLAVLPGAGLDWTDLGSMETIVYLSQEVVMKVIDMLKRTHV